MRLHLDSSLDWQAMDTMRLSDDLYQWCICSCGLASNVRVYADCTVLEKPVEDSCDDDYNNNYTDNHNDDNTNEDDVASDDEEPVENGWGRWGGEKQRTRGRPEKQKVFIGLNLRMRTKLLKISLMTKLTNLPESALLVLWGESTFREPASPLMNRSNLSRQASWKINWKDLLLLLKVKSPSLIVRTLFTW